MTTLLPSADAVSGILSTVEPPLTEADKQLCEVAICRLNRIEDHLTVQDLLGVDVGLKHPLSEDQEAGGSTATTAASSGLATATRHPAGHAED